MKYSIKPTSKFQKDLKRIQKRGYDLSLLSDVIKKLSNGESLPLKYRDHNLIGNFCGCRECHITPGLASSSTKSTKKTFISI